MVFSIGHSNYKLEKFVDLLLQHNIHMVFDVRSVPYSKFTQHFNREKLEKSLTDLGLMYIFAGEYLGGRPNDKKFYKEGKVDFGLLAKDSRFRKSLSLLKAAEKRFRICIMCAEKNPVKCHRHTLLAKELKRIGVNVAHILEDGSTISYTEMVSNT